MDIALESREASELAFGSGLKKQTSSRIVCRVLCPGSPKRLGCPKSSIPLRKFSFLGMKLVMHNSRPKESPEISLKGDDTKEKRGLG